MSLVRIAVEKGASGRNSLGEKKRAEMNLHQGSEIGAPYSCSQLQQRENEAEDRDEQEEIMQSKKREMRRFARGRTGVVFLRETK